MLGYLLTFVSNDFYRWVHRHLIWVNIQILLSMKENKVIIENYLVNISITIDIDVCRLTDGWKCFKASSDSMSESYGSPLRVTDRSSVWVVSRTWTVDDDDRDREEEPSCAIDLLSISLKYVSATKKCYWNKKREWYIKFFWLIQI